MQIESKFFNTRAKDLSGNFTDKPISRYDFISDAGRFLVANKNEIENFGEVLYDYSATLSAIVKAELLQEMRNRVDHIDTFYHV